MDVSKELKSKTQPMIEDDDDKEFYQSKLISTFTTKESQKRTKAFKFWGKNTLEMLVHVGPSVDGSSVGA